MSHKYSCGAVLYRKNKNIFEYLIIKDSHGIYSFPNGHKEKGETIRRCVVREVYEEVGLDLEPDPYFLYEFSYSHASDMINFAYFMADMADAVPHIGDDEVQSIEILPYKEAYEMLIYGRLKDVLKEVNDRLVNDMKICCMFADEKSFDKRNLEPVKYYGSVCNGHSLYTWDEGDRTLYRCKKCGAYVLEQCSEIHMPDKAYIDYFPVRDERHAEEINGKYNGWSIERDYPYKKVFYAFDNE